MIKYFKGDVLNSPAGLIAHGCNCRGGFGSGIAGQIAKRFPHVRQAYLDKFRSQGWVLGEIQPVALADGRQIINSATQLNYGSPRGGVVYVSYEAIRTVMEQLKSLAETTNQQVALPKIGAGLAGGDWKKIEQIINEVFGDREVWVYVF